MSRVPLTPDDPADPAVRRVFDSVRAAGRELPDLYRALANAPEMLKLWVDFASGIRSGSTVARSTRELAIMRVALLEDSDYEWRHHWKLASAAGATEEQLRFVGVWTTSLCYSETERAALRAADELVADATLSAATWDELCTHWSHSQVIEILLTISFYLCVGRMIRALDLGLEDRYLQVPGVAQARTDN
jgi:alkylhydroperoxidase family enzyme